MSNSIPHTTPAREPAPVPPARVIASYDEIARAVSTVSLEAAGAASPLPELALEATGIDGLDDEGPVDPVDLALFQVALGQALDALEEERDTPGILHTSPNPLASMMQSLLVEHAIRTGNVAEAATGNLEAKFDRRDVAGWFRSLFNWWQRLVPAEFLPPPKEPDPLPSEVRLALMGDWGTGLYGAPIISRTLEQLRADQQPHLVVHLGDVYYAGTPREMKYRFLELWPKLNGALSRGCNGNHEMYSGGIPFFGQVLPTFKQTSSCWAFQNEHWLLVGLDSAWAPRLQPDHTLYKGQVKWLNQLLRQAGDRRLILFCHHQPFSVLEKGGERLAKKLIPLLSTGRVFAWYWGHEHRCLLYDPRPDWGGMRGRCIGHGGMPYLRDHGDRLTQPGWWTAPAKHGLPGGQLLGGPNEHIPGEEKRFGPNGYALLEFSGPRLEESIYLPDGKQMHQDALA